MTRRSSSRVFKVEAVRFVRDPSNKDPPRMTGRVASIIVECDPETVLASRAPTYIDNAQIIIIEIPRQPDRADKRRGVDIGRGSTSASYHRYDVMERTWDRMVSRTNCTARLPAARPTSVLDG